MAVTGIVLMQQSMQSFGDSAAEITENAVLNSEKARLKSLMDSVQSIIEPYIDLPGDTGKEEAMSLLKRFLFDEGIGYVFGYSYDGTRLPHHKVPVSHAPHQFLHWYWF
jgi:methyl-accepting chemotaxis protein